MDSVVLQSVTKTFRHRPALFNWIGRETNGETRALENISLRLSAGEVLVLVGPNGSGKTTLLKLISTVLLPDRGHVYVQGVDTKQSSTKARQSVGYAVAAERSFFPRLTAQENLDFFAALDNVPRHLRGERIEAQLERVGLENAASTLVMRFSSGMYQRLGIARALLKNPSILLLDEPTRSLDPAAMESFWTFVCELPEARVAVAIASHNFREAAAVGTSIMMLKQGRMAGSKALHRTSAQELREFYFDATRDFSGIEASRSEDEALPACG